MPDKITVTDEVVEFHTWTDAHAHGLVKCLVKWRVVREGDGTLRVSIDVIGTGISIEPVATNVIKLKAV